MRERSDSNSYGAVKPENAPEMLRLKNWERHWRRYRTVPLPVNVRKAEESVPYALWLDEIRGVQIPAALREPPAGRGRDRYANDRKLGFRLYASLLHRSTRIFFGRTWTSAVHVLDDRTRESSRELILDCKEPVYFHTAITDKECVVVVEVVLVELVDESVISREMGVGWGMFPLAPTRRTEASMYAGTPRALFLLTDQDFPTLRGATVRYEIAEYGALESVLNLLPADTLIGCDDKLPGIKGRNLPGDLRTEPTMLSPVELKIQSVEVSFPKQHMDQFLDDVSFHFEKLHGSRVNPTIESIHLRMCIHNGWTIVNPKKMNETRLDESGRGVFGFDGLLGLRGFASDELCALVFELVANVVASGRDGRDQQSLVVGWAVYVPIEKNYFIGGKIEKDLMHGPGTSPTGQLTWAGLNRQNVNRGGVEPLRLSFVLRHAGGGEDLHTRDAPAVSVNEERGRARDHPRDHPRDRSVDRERSASAGRRDRYDEDMEEEKAKLRAKRLELDRELEEVQRRNDVLLTERRVKEKALTEREIEIERERLRERERRLKEQEEAFEEEKRRERQRDRERYGLADYPAGHEHDEDHRRESSHRRPRSRSRDVEEDATSPYRIRPPLPRRSPDMFYSSTDHAYTYPPPPVSTNISRADKAKLVQAGVKGLLDRPEDMPLGEGRYMRSVDYEVEYTDILQANEIVIQFLAFKVPPPSTVSNAPLYIPRSMYFTFCFYTFPAVETERVRLQNAAGREVSNRLDVEEPLILVKERPGGMDADTAGLVIRFAVDPISGRTDESIHLTRYFQFKTLKVDVWDADSLLQIGSVEVDMQELIRQQRPSAKVAKEFEIFDKVYNRSAGRLQMLLANFGRESRAPPPIASRAPVLNAPIRISSDPQHRDGVARKRRVKARPLHEQDLAVNMAKEMSAYGSSVDARKRARVEMWRRQHNQPTQGPTLSLPDNFAAGSPNAPIPAWDRQKRLTKIAALREQSKQLVVERLLREHLSTHVDIHPCTGEALFIEFEFKNPFNHEEAFSIVIEDPERDVLSQPELRIITDPQEWRYWVDLKQGSIPPDYAFVSKDLSFVLKGNETVPLPVKFISFRPPSPVSSLPTTPQAMQQRDPSFIAPRTIRVLIHQSGRQSVSVLEVHVKPLAPPLDSVIRLYQPRDSFMNTRLQLTSELRDRIKRAGKTGHGNGQGPFIHCTSDRVVAYWDGSADDPDLDLDANAIVAVKDREITALKDSRELVLKCKVGRSGDVNRFIVCIYEDEYFATCLHTWEIEVYGLESETIKVIMGEHKTHQVYIRGLSPRMVMPYAAHPDMILFHQDEPFQLLAGTSQAVDFEVRCNSPGPRQTKIHLVDIKTRELVGAWLLQIEPSIPEVKRTYSVDLPLGRSANRKIVFQNPLKDPVVYLVRSSNPQIAEVREVHLPLAGHEKAPIRLRFPAKHAPSYSEVFVFVTDTEERDSSCLLIRVRYA